MIRGLCSFHKYAGCTMEIIYFDRKHNITQRRIQVRSVEDGDVKAFCLKQNAPRMFKLDRILAAQLVSARSRE